MNESINKSRHFALLLLIFNTPIEALIGIPDSHTPNFILQTINWARCRAITLLFGKALNSIHVDGNGGEGVRVILSLPSRC